MRHRLHSTLAGLPGLLLLLAGGSAAAAGPTIQEVRTPVLDLYTQWDGPRTDERPAEAVPLPLEVLEIASNGRFRVRIGETEYWVSPAQVKTDRKHYLAAECGQVIHNRAETAGTRGLGEGCEQ